jgi:hypothetical protein
MCVAQLKSGPPVTTTPKRVTVAVKSETHTVDILYLVMGTVFTKWPISRTETIYMRFSQCVAFPATQQELSLPMAHEGFTELEDLEQTWILRRRPRGCVQMASRTQADKGRVLLGTSFIIKRLLGYGLETNRNGDLLSSMQTDCSVLRL